MKVTIQHPKHPEVDISESYDTTPRGRNKVKKYLWWRAPSSTTILHLIGFFFSKKEINCNFVDISPSFVGIPGRYVDKAVRTRFPEVVI